MFGPRRHAGSFLTTAGLALEPLTGSSGYLVASSSAQVHGVPNLARRLLQTVGPTCSLNGSPAGRPVRIGRLDVQGAATKLVHGDCRGRAGRAFFVSTARACIGSRPDIAIWC